MSAMPGSTITSMVHALKGWSWANSTSRSKRVAVPDGTGLAVPEARACLCCCDMTFVFQLCLLDLLPAGTGDLFLGEAAVIDLVGLEALERAEVGVMTGLEGAGLHPGVATTDDGAARRSTLGAGDSVMGELLLALSGLPARTTLPLPVEVCTPPASSGRPWTRSPVAEWVGEWVWCGWRMGGCERFLPEEERCRATGILLLLS